MFYRNLGLRTHRTRTASLIICLYNSRYSSIDKLFFTYGAILNNPILNDQIMHSMSSTICLLKTFITNLTEQRGARALRRGRGSMYLKLKEQPRRERAVYQ